MRRRENRLSVVLRTVVVYLFVLWCLLPVLWLVQTSLKSDAQAFDARPILIFAPQWSNFAKAWSNGYMAQAMGASTLVALVSSVVGIACGLPLAYLTTQVWPAWSRGARRMNLTVLLLTTVPPVLGLTPLFRLFDDVGLQGGLVGITVVHSFYAVLLAFLILRSFLAAFPREIREAALMDGAGEWRALFQCVAPSMVGGLFATFILALIQSWNEYLYALVLTSGSSQTVPVRVASFFTFVGTNWSTLTASGVIGTLPIVIFAILVRKYLARGLTYGGVK